MWRGRMDGGGEKMKVTVYRDETGFEALAPEWDVLLRQSRADTIFMTWMWQTTWWRHLGEGDLRILAVRDDGGALVGLAPLFRIPHEGPGVFSTVGCVDVSDYVDWVLRQGQEEAALAALLDTLGNELAHEWGELSLCNIPDGSPTLELLAPLAQARGWQVTRAIEEVVPLFRLPESWEAFEQMLRGKARRELRRKLRKAGPYSGVDWYIVGPEHDLSAQVDAFIEQLIKSHPEKADFMDARNRAFFHALGRATFDAGQLQLAFLTLNGQHIGAYMNFLYGERVMVYNSGLDPAAYRLSPGIVLMAHLIRHAIERQEHEIFDFLRGDEPYKYSLGGTDTHIYRLRVKRDPGS
jgi:CelD/BcsL family acetyltransferase involved in cellulose biosynthesis